MEAAESGKGVREVYCSRNQVGAPVAQLRIYFENYDAGSCAVCLPVI